MFSISSKVIPYKNEGENVIVLYNLAVLLYTSVIMRITEDLVKCRFLDPPPTTNPRDSDSTDLFNSSF